MSNQIYKDKSFTSIIIHSYNNLDRLKMCVSNVVTFTNVPYELIIIDDASTDGTVEWLNQQDNIKIILNDEYIGYVKSINNAVMSLKNNADILLLNVNVIVTPNWLYNLQLALYSKDDIGAVSPVSNIGDRVKINYENLDIDKIVNFSKDLNIINKGKWCQRINLNGFCMFIKRKVFDDVGLFDETLENSNVEDDDYSYRMLLKGYTLIVCQDVFVHKEFNNKESNIKFNKKNFDKKWGFSTIYSSSIRSDLISFINCEKEKQINVLEVGCGCGATLLEIKNIYTNANVYGIELNPNSAEIAKMVADIKNCSVEEKDLGYDENFFDYIIFGDVLEHLYEPWAVLDNIKKYLKLDGVVLASIPNIMNFTNIQNLMSGYWTYEASGLLDKTHIRFFTKLEIINMFKSSGYSEINCDNYKFISGGDDFINKLVSLTSESKRAEFKAFQYLVSAKKRPEIKVEILNQEDILGYEENIFDVQNISEMIDFLLIRIENRLDSEECINKLILFLDLGSITVEDIHSKLNANLCRPDLFCRKLSKYCLQYNMIEQSEEFLAIYNDIRRDKSGRK